MIELFEKINGIDKKIDSLTKAVHDLTILVMKDKVNDTWISEDIAAELVGYNPQSFRRKVKDAHKNNKEPWNLISYRNSNGRNWYYSRKSLMEFQRKTSIDQ